MTAATIRLVVSSVVRNYIMGSVILRAHSWVNNMNVVHSPFKFRIRFRFLKLKAVRQASVKSLRISNFVREAAKKTVFF